MIIQKSLDSWSQFRPAVREIREQYGFHEIELSGDRTFKQRNVVLFRGQSASSWPLATTLERKTQQRLDVLAYLVRANACIDEVRSVTGRSWNVPLYPAMQEELERTQDFMRLHLPAYDYLVYLRHHGFPSPLLDWTESPYVAAFFAFWHPCPENEVAIYAFAETVTGIRSGWEGESRVYVMGPHVSTAVRHFAQKAWYTVAAEWDGEREKHHFCSHDVVFGKQNPNEEILIKLTIPASERREALTELRDYNIDPFTLFQSEDALIQSMTLKQFDLNDLTS